MAGEDTEITLGAGKLLGLFFLLVAICGVFFAVGYSLGKTSAREQVLNDHPAENVSSATDPAINKPSAAVAAKPEATPVADAAQAKQEDPDLTFYKNVKQNGADATTPVQQAKPVPAGKTTPATSTEGSAAQAAMIATLREPKAAAIEGSTTAPLAAAKSPASVPANSIPISVTGMYLVQIAAVSHEEDAAALAGALRKKNYNAAVVNSLDLKDKLFHVVIGPFATLQDADSMKLKLRGEGYNPIVKR